MTDQSAPLCTMTTSQNSTKVACGEALWYNEDLKALIPAMRSTSGGWINLNRRSIMDSLYPHAKNGNISPQRCYKEDCKHPAIHTDDQQRFWCGHHWRRRERITNTSTKICILCDKVKLSHEFKRAIENEPAIKNEICKSCFTWLIVKIKKHSQRADTPLLLEVWLKALGQSEGYCHYCKEFVGFRFLSIEHKTPICKGGSNQENNIVAACRPCNCRKPREVWE
jgi:HNH endonuclease